MCKPDVIREAFFQMRKGKTKRKEIIEIEKNLDENIEKMRVMLENTKPDDVTVEHPEFAFKPLYREPVEIIERGKPRKLYKPSIWEQWVHNIILVVLEPIFRKRFYEHAYGCMSLMKSNHKKRRPVYMRKMEEWIHGGFKYFLKLDIRHCYDNMKIKNVLNHLRSFICDEWVLFLIYRCYMLFDRYGNFVQEMHGLCLGYRLSPWLCYSYLTDVDYLIQQECGYKKYMRYADDMVICGNNKKKMQVLLSKIKQALGKLRLRLKGNWQLCRFDYKKKNGNRIGRPIDFMGFKYYRDKTFLRKHILYRMERVAHNISRMKLVYHKQAASICGTMGYITHTDCYKWYVERIKPYVIIGKMKRIVSKQSRKEAKYDRMETGNLRNRDAGRTCVCFA